MALSDASIRAENVDGIAFTRGPGMAGCLAVCSNAARTLAAALNKPLVGVHHMQAHALTAALTTPEDQLPQFPFLTLLISGGHTLIVLANSQTSFRILASTKDESIGRAFDDVARMLGLSWSTHGLGAALERFCNQPTDTSAASEGIPEFPSVLRGKLEFSYSALHAHVERFLRSRDRPLDELSKLALARAFQDAAFTQLEEKLTLALNRCRQKGINIGTVVVSGGVASNLYLRDMLRKRLDEYSAGGEPIGLLFPPPSLCTDNAAMIGWASMHRFLAEDIDEYTVDILPKWSIEDITEKKPHREQNP
ncbi:hypothetical protein NLI96_g1082 [Meripilus lineatus]|uniref:N(6)-L-threonylcarbamoyladenine synthase n=1 Tax=Meripilus lineatus TaxID=2056292 RepID=A0AAD5VCL4_9APHY|nr:hypothetical protein NLI96_g1082 [Physisporinus lineatus]